jgi:hypothetical protein
VLPFVKLETDLMNPSEQGWLKEFLESRKAQFKDLSSESNKTTHPEYSLYRIIQPTGLMYGQSVGVFEQPESKKWTEKDKMKILLAECLMSSSILFFDKPIKKTEDLDRVIEKTLENIGNFYNNVFPELATSSKTLFGRKKQAIELAERIIEKRIEYTSEHKNNFWAQFFHNSLLFLDIFIFGQWIHTNADKIVADFFKYEREELRFSVVKIIAGAAHSNVTVEFEERKLLEYFLNSSGLSYEKRKEAQLIFDEGIEIQAMNLPTNNSWILKKYFLEMAILTLWADKKVDEVEINFLRELCQYLNFNEDDLENSLMAIEGFVLEHWEQLSMLQNKKDYNEVSEQFIKRISKIIDRNKNRLVREVKENEQALTLLTKARVSELNETEAIAMQEVLIQTLKKIPTFSIIPLPEKFLALPMLLKILPANFFTEVLA